MSEKHIKILADDPYRRDTQEWNYDHNEYSITWKNVIFIPFNRLWQYVVMSSVIINALYVIYDITYNKEGVEFGADALIYYTAWLLYFIDTALSIAHKNMSAYREVQAQNPKSTHRLALDAISLIPFYEMYVLVKAASRIHTNEKSIKNIFRIQSLIRIHPVFTHLLFSFSEINTYDIITSITVSHHLKLVLLGHIIAALWYSQGCWNCDIPNWTDSLNEFDFNKNNSAQWFIVSYCTVANTLINNWGGYNCGITIVERLITLTTMLLGFILHYLTYLGMLLIAYLKVHKKQLTWSENFKDIQKYLVYSKVNKEWCDKTIAYYKYLWKERSGIKDMPKTFRRLPMQLQKEVTVDIYWEAFKHSHLFCGQSLAFKRDLSLQMKNEFFVPGDYVYKVREVKDKMIYIVSGILQVLAQEDEESPIMSFSSDASSEIQKHVFKNRLIACVEGVPLFANLDREVIDCIINNCLIKTLPAGVEITKCGKRTSSIYFILQGYCEMHSEMAGDIQRNTATVLSAGMAFPIVEVLHEVECLTTIVTTTAVEMMCLKMHRLNEIINSNVEFKTNLNEALKKHYREYNQLLYLDNSRLPPMVPIERSLGKSNMFKYKVNDDDSKEKELEYQKPFNQLGMCLVLAICRNPQETDG
ncbi:hypothetical protein RN001_011219 [Aquatica leii]|uniref:Cyclic nucleotide-binding domain-containing protein n=1 Tax=Aquatica leii TaxID=1421715 RepID=A0AAN7SNN1_9COLE|nr:hypothetical protein RN001_011219 [Aquatica leii]